ncbi:caspase-8 isoform X4 [Gadus macrocephalus]|uniref:caspase-8 isoform X4 n=1 Tax=Gadus macrocephalus TaxID=80720 RepID=UPI0028CB763B|nr:caspase-8 isoform X4 [Gadus macrocephalus]
MDLTTLASIDDDLDSSEVAALCFLCRDVLSKKGLKKVKDGKDLFKQLDEKDLLSNSCFLYQLLRIIKREDLLSRLQGDVTQTDSIPIVTDYREMLYNLYEDVIEKNLKKMKYLLGDKGVGRGQIELCTTALDVFSLMEDSGLLSRQRLDQLQEILKECDSQLVNTVQKYINGDPGAAQSLVSDSDFIVAASSVLHPVTTATCQDFYTLRNNPRGTCLVINNEHFTGGDLRNRRGTLVDEESLQQVFGKLGFQVVVHSDLTADAIRRVLEDLGKMSFYKADVLVVCVLSHGENECVFGTDGKKVSLRDLRMPFTSARAPTLAGKPKLFFIQACQGSTYQKGVLPCPPRPQDEEARRTSMSLEEDAGPLPAELVAEEADFLMGMATVEECISFRHISKGSIYIQELCKQLLVSAKRKDDLLTTLTRVNREVSKGDYLRHKQMPQPKYTLTKKLVLTEMETEREMEMLKN